MTIYKAKRFFWALCCLFFGLHATFAQQNQTLTMSRDIWQSSFANPAFQPNRKFILALPGGQFDYYLPQVRVKDIFSVRNALNFERSLDALKEQNELASRQNAELFGVGVKIKDGWFMLHGGVSGTQRVVFPKDMARLLLLGNGNFIGEELNVAPVFEFSANTEIGLQAAWKFSEKFEAGIRARRYWGLFDVSANPADIKIYTDTSRYDITITTDYQINGSQAIEDISWDEGERFPTIKTKGGSNRGRGFGLDLGATYRITDQWAISASVINIGNIKWTGGTALRSRGTFEFEGLNLESILQSDSLRFSEQIDTFVSLLEPQKVEGASYTQQMPTRYIVSAEYRPTDKWTLHGAITHERNQKVNYTGLMLGARWSPIRLIDVGLNYNARYGFAFNFGGYMALNLGPWQIYGVADNVVNAFIPLQTTNYNARLGMNLAFGKPKPDKKETY